MRLAGSLARQRGFVKSRCDTPDEAVREVLIAKQAIVEVMREKGLPIPEPRYRPAIYQVRA
jgi:predicted RNase H-like HicB family nuclease